MTFKAEQDGKTHINVYSKGATLVGRLCSNMAHTPFVLSADGPFASVEGYWYWLAVQDDRLRRLVGFEAKKLGKQLRPRGWTPDGDFRRAILVALKVKLSAHPQIVALLRESDLPLAHYYSYRIGEKNVIVDKTKESAWMLEVFERARAKVTTREGA